MEKEESQNKENQNLNEENSELSTENQAKDETEKSLRDFIESLSSVQFLKVSEFLQNMPALSYDLNFKCVNCGKDNTTELRGLASFFT